MYASEKTSAAKRHLFFRRDNEQNVCGADDKHEVRFCEYKQMRAEKQAPQSDI